MLSNLLALLGVVCIVVAVAGLAGGWWSLLVVGLVLIVSAWVQWTGQPAAVAEGGDE